MATSQKGSFEIEINAFSKFIAAINALVPECRLHISKNLIYAAAIDIARVAQIDAKIENIKCNGEVILGLDLTVIGSAIKSIDQLLPCCEEAIAQISWETCSWLNDGYPLLHIKIPSIEYHAQFETVDLTTIRKDPDNRNLNLTTEFTCNGERFARAINSHSESNDFRIESNEEGDVFAAAKYCRYQSRFKIAEGGTNPAKSLFSLDYLEDIAKVLETSLLEIRLDTDRPMSITASPRPGLSVTYLIAPRIEPPGSPEWIS